LSRIRRAAYCIGFPAILICLVALVAGCGSGSNTTTTKQAAATPPPEPSVELHLNQGSFSQTGSQATLTGTVTPASAVTVNEHPADVHGTHLHGTVQHLRFGENTIVVSAALAGHQAAEDTITVTRHHTQAELATLAQAKKEREARRREKEEQREREERAHKEVEERKEREEKEVEDATLSQQNALKSAEQYLQTTAFSEAGLIEQLSSEDGSKFPHADAVFAVEHLHVNWNEQAVKAAEEYLKTSSFSCQGLTEQLSSEDGSKFTAAQAEYAANKVGLC
jgi:Host cell surface-exposed lipoprotein